jgi:HSP20 family molecular chaperone IbpA
MTGKRGRTGRDASEFIDLRLGDLFGELGAALTEMIGRLDEGGSGEIRREHRIETARGPIRTQAGIRIRMGGLDAAGGGHDPARPRAPRVTPAPAPPAARPAARPIEADIVSDGGLWRLMADLPGASRDTLDIAVEDGQLAVSARTPTRQYADRFDLPPGVTLDGLRISLENGILEIETDLGGERAP